MKRKPRPTLVDIARAAGVGLGTASRVINGGENVSAATLDKVQAAIRLLRYEPNHTARMLRGGRTKMVGLLVPSIADSFFSSCAEAAEEVARQNDSLLIVAVSNNDPAVELEKLSVLTRQRPDGLLIAPADNMGTRFRTFVRSLTLPVITLDRPVPGIPGVLTDNYEAARKATAHLLNHGYRRILCYTGEPHLFTIKERMRGYCDEMKQHGLATLMDTSFNENEAEAEQRVVRYMRGLSRPDAIFTLKNSATIATFQILQRLQIAVPQQLALFGFDDFLLAGTLQPSISVVQQPIYDVGRKAAELLFKTLETAQSGAAILQAKRVKPIVLNCLLVPRASCGCQADATAASELSSRSRQELSA